jgi:hypothetical protein
VEVTPVDERVADLAVRADCTAPQDAVLATVDFHGLDCGLRASRGRLAP